jgi:hypothetical protein
METEALSVDPTIVSRYLADQLTDSELAAFEAALAHDPAVLRELEATARLKVGLHRLRATGELDELLREAPAVPSFTWIAVAAGVVALGIGIALWRPTSEPVGRPFLATASSMLSNEAGRPLPLSGAYVVMRTRAEELTRIELPPGRAAIELRVFPQLMTQPPTYRATLIREVPGSAANESAAVLRGLHSDQEGFVRLYVDSAKLRTGRYRLVLGGETAEADNSETFELNVVPRAADGGGLQ